MTRPYDEVPVVAQDALEWDGQGPNVAAMNGVIDNLQRQILAFSPEGVPSIAGQPPGVVLTVNNDTLPPTAQWSQGWVTPPNLVADGVTDNSAAVAEIADLINAGNNVAVLAPGVYRYVDQWPVITGSGGGLYCAPGVIFEANHVGDTAVRVFGGNSVWQGGEFRNFKYRHYQITGASAVGDGFGTILTLDVSDGPHDLEVNDICDCRWLVNANPGGGASFYNSAAKIVAVNVDGIHVTIETWPGGVRTASLVSPTVAYPVNPLDGSGRQIFPELYRSRTTNRSDVFEFRNCSAKLYNVTMKWGIVGLLASEQWHDGVMQGCEVTETAADGVHIVNGYNLWLDANHIYNTQDDCIALLAHTHIADRPRPCNILITRNLIENGRTRGIALIGAEACTIAFNTVRGVSLAGLYLAHEVGFFGSDEINIHENLIQTCGNAGALMTGWPSTTQPAVFFGPGNGTYKRVGRIKFTGCNRIWNARTAAVSGNTTATVHVHGMTIDEMDIEEAAGNGFSTFHFADLMVKRLRIVRCGGHGMIVASGSTGINSWDEIDFWDVNRGTRRYIKSLSVTAQVLTLILEDNVVNPFVGGETVIVAGVKSNNTTGGGGAASDTAVTVDYTINSFSPDGLSVAGNYTVASVAGQTVVMNVNPNLSATNTTHAGVLNESSPCPQAYVALQSGTSGTNDALNFDTSVPAGARHIIKRAVLRTANYSFNNFFDPATAAAQRIAIESPVDLTGTKNMALSPICTTPFIGAWASNATTISTVGATTLSAFAWIKQTGITRTGLTADTFDTTDTAANIITQLGLAVNQIVTLPMINNNAFLWGFVGGANVTLPASGIAIPAMMELEVQLKHVTAGNLTLTPMYKSRDLVKSSSYGYAFEETADANAVMNSEMLAGRIYWRSGMTAPRNSQLPSPSNMFGAMLAKIGTKFVFQVWNSSAAATTLTDPSGFWTAVGGMVINATSKATFQIEFLTATTARITRMTLTDT